MLRLTRDLSYLLATVLTLSMTQYISDIRKLHCLFLVRTGMVAFKCISSPNSKLIMHGSSQVEVIRAYYIKPDSGILE